MSTSVPLPIVAFVAVFGLLVGSFLNVVVYRVPREESIAFPASHCPACSTPIRFRHNVPVIGWLMLRGRCAACRERISVRYPLVEVGTAALFAAITMRFGLTAGLPAYLFLGAVGLTLALIEMDARRLPNSIVLPSYVISVLMLMPAGAASGDWRPAVRALAGMAALLGIYLMLAMAYPPGIGLGDVKLAGLLGLYLGWLSWSAVLVGAAGGILLGGAATMAAARRVSGSRAIAVSFGPAMVGAAGAALFVTAPITTWYASLVGAA